jgi:hypothetical protein
MSITIAQVIINDSSDKTITGAYVFDRENGGSLSIPALNYFPTTPLAGELIWRIDENLIYRRNDLNTAWNSIYAQIDILNSTAGDIIYYNGTTWTRLPAGVVGQFLQTNGVGQAPNWEGITVPDGAVSGSGFSINNSIPRFNGIDGYSIKSSLVTIDDNGNLLTPGNIDGYDLSYTFQDIYNRIITDHSLLTGLYNDDHTQYLLANGTRNIDGSIAFSGDGYCLDNTGCIVFSLAREPADIPYEEGKLFYDTDNGCPSFFGKSPNTSLQIGQELVLYCYNGTASTITNGSAVYISGAYGNRPSISLASATSINTSDLIGLATESILPGQSGYITISGLVHDLDTLNYPVGSRLYLSTTPGQLTTIPPINSGIVMFLGLVTYQHQTQGIVAVAVKTPASLSTLHDVYNGSPTDGYHLKANGTYWTTSDFSNDVLNSIGNVTNEPTGFPVSGGGDNSTLTINNSTRTFTITPSSSSFDIWLQGTKHTYTTPQSCVLTSTEGIHFIYFNTNGVLSSVEWSEDLSYIFAGISGTPVAYVYWDSTNNSTIYFAEERHGIQMDGATHVYLHNTSGAQYSSGGGFDNFVVDGTGSVASNAEFAVNSVIIFDEDIVLNSLNTDQLLSYPAQIPVFYRSGPDGYWRRKNADNYPIIYSGSGGYTGANGLVAYNQYTGITWQLTQVPNNQFVLVHYYACNELNNGVIGIQGQNVYSSIASARNGAETEITTIQGTIKLLAKEAVPLGTVIWQTSTGYTNVPHARIRSTDTGDDYIDFRERQLTGTGSTVLYNFPDNLFKIYDSTDTTKQLYLELANITTATTRTLTIPDRNITIGNVLGPISLTSTDNSITRWDGTAGQLIQNSLVTIDDNGNILTPGTVDGYDLSLRFQSISESLAGIITDHGNLIGLSDDDHAQYLLASGLRSMSGNLNIGGYDIVNVNSIDGYNLELSFQNISNHISNTSNPHNTTLANIGAGTLAQLNAAISDADVTPTTRSIISGNGLTGGGDLSADRTIAVAAADTTITVNADSIQVGVITDTNHGTRGGGTLHSVATTSVAGFESAADKTKLDQLVNNSHLITVSATQPTSPTTGDIWIDISGS